MGFLWDLQSFTIFHHFNIFQTHPQSFKTAPFQRILPHPQTPYPSKHQRVEDLRPFPGLGLRHQRRVELPHRDACLAEVVAELHQLLGHRNQGIIWRSFV